MGRLLFIGVLLILLIGVGAYYLMQRSQNLNSTVTPTLIPSEVTQVSVTSIPEDSDLGAGGSSFLDPKGVFSLLYPNDWKQDTQNNGQIVRFYMLGATQRGQTEIYDGIVMNFEVVELKGQTLSQWVDTQIKNSTNDGTSEILGPKKTTTLNSYPGYMYQLRGLGVFDYIAIQKDTNSDFAVIITNLVADPENVGYQKKVDAVLSSLKILK